MSDRTVPRRRFQQEPPKPIKPRGALYDEPTVTSDPNEQNRFLGAILAIAQENFWVIGLASPAAVNGARRNSLKFVPDSMPGAAVYLTPGLMNSSQEYVDS